MINDCKGSRGESSYDLVDCRTKNGEYCSFWFSRWNGSQNLSEAFSKLFAFSAKPFLTVAEAGAWTKGVWTWNESKKLRTGVENALWLDIELYFPLDRAYLDEEEEDAFVWNAATEECFSAGSCASVFSGRE